MRRPLVKLGPAHEAFCLHYVARPHNATAAYIAAGFSPNSAKQAVHQLLQDALIRARVKALIEEKHRALHMDVDEILARTAMLARVDAAALYDEDGKLRPVHELETQHSVGIAGLEVQEITEGTGDKAKVVGTIKKVRLRDPMPALRLLAEHKKLVKSPDEGLNALASALADRLKLARERRRQKDSTK